MFAALTAGLLPGRITLNLLGRTGALGPRGLIERILASISLGFSLNLLINLGLLFVGCSFAQAFQFFLVAVPLIACGLLVFRGRLMPTEEPLPWDWRRDALTIAIMVLGSAWRICGSAAANPEELASLRKTGRVTFGSSGTSPSSRASRSPTCSHRFRCWWPEPLSSPMPT